MAVSFYTLFTPMNLPALTPRHNTSGRLAIWIVLVFLFTACCNDREVAQLQRDSTEHAAELREIQDASLSYVYIEYERNLENTLWFAGHCWDKTLTLEAFLLLLGLMLAFTILVKRVPFIYQWLDGSPEIGLNTMCLVSVFRPVYLADLLPWRWHQARPNRLGRPEKPEPEGKEDRAKDDRSMDDRP